MTELSKVERSGASSQIIINSKGDRDTPVTCSVKNTGYKITRLYKGPGFPPKGLELDLESTKQLPQNEYFRRKALMRLYEIMFAAREDSPFYPNPAEVQQRQAVKAVFLKVAQEAKEDITRLIHIYLPGKSSFRAGQLYRPERSVSDSQMDLLCETQEVFVPASTLVVQREGDGEISKIVSTESRERQLMPGIAFALGIQMPDIFPPKHGDAFLIAPRIVLPQALNPDAALNFAGTAITHDMRYVDFIRPFLKGIYVLQGPKNAKLFDR